MHDVMIQGRARGNLSDLLPQFVMAMRCTKPRNLNLVSINN